ncbi:ABC-2 transporter permease [Oceanobacillus jordanicus]|uniref:ABC-2 transporter permease n=1 Tax=Oceanobacillus jordanicus TaxID=2867266 RepID=A0AAW5B758_9BACI|nr:ABC-2 transporter permease [Oceanobacillus jordanicus]MCG3420250.1 ABC-2 transporter permease [Oceanobacillus jordanicus]
MILHLMKKDFYINSFYYGFNALLIPLFYVMGFTESYFFFVIMIHFLFNLFYFDHRNHVNRFISSLPVKLHHVVLSRHLYLLLFLIGFLLYVWLVDSIASKGLPYLTSQPIDALSITLLFTTICIVVSLSMPIYYLVTSFNKAFVIQMGLLVFSTFAFSVTLGNDLITFHEPILSWFSNLIEIQPIIILVAISLVFLYLSYLLSAWIYTKKAKV